MTFANNGQQYYLNQSPASLRVALSKDIGTLQASPINLLNYGADRTGSGDSTAALNTALAAQPGSAVYVPSGTYKITSQIVIPAGTMLYGDGMGITTFVFNNPSNNQFVIGGNEVTAQYFTISITGLGINSNVAAVNINGADYCEILRIEVIGASWGGVGLFTTSSHNLVEKCYFHGFQGTIQDSADIILSYQTGPTDYNIIRDNYCLGGNETGIHMLGNVGSNPQYNLITGNRIGQHTTYGIMDYHNANGLDGFNQISDNYIENIQGTTRPGGGTSASGAGIYIAGAGGDSIKGNIVRNCCVQTTFRSLVPAGIAVTLGPAGQAPVNVIGNTVEGMTKWDGICVASSANGANIVGNMVRMPANTTGSAAINILGSSNVVCTDNAIDITPVTGTTVDGIDVNLTTSQNNVVISNNRITGGNARGIYITSGGAPTLTTATISGNILSGSGGGANGIDVMNLIGVTITGNNVNTTTNKALNIATCTQTRVSNNVLITTGTTAVATSGTCTGSILDESNYLSSSAGTQLNAVSNAGTLLNMRQLGTIAPTSGTQILGDVVYSTTGVSPFALWCTAAGSPGTFTGLTIP